MTLPKFIDEFRVFYHVLILLQSSYSIMVVLTFDFADKSTKFFSSEYEDILGLTMSYWFTINKLQKV